MKTSLVSPLCPVSLILTTKQTRKRNGKETCYRFLSHCCFDRHPEVFQPQPDGIFSGYWQPGESAGFSQPGCSRSQKQVSQIEKCCVSQGHKSSLHSLKPVWLHDRINIACVLRNIPSQVRDLVARMKNDPVHNLLWKTSTRRVWFKVKRRQHCAVFTDHRLGVRLEAYNRLHRWKRSVRPLLQLCERYLESTRTQRADTQPTCSSCRFSSQLLYSVENFMRNMRDSLDYLHKEVRRITPPWF